MRGLVDEIIAVRGGLLEDEAIVMAADQDETRIADAQASQHIVTDASTGAADEESGAHVLLPANQRDATDGTHVQRVQGRHTRRRLAHLSITTPSVREKRRMGCGRWASRSTS